MTSYTYQVNGFFVFLTTVSKTMSFSMSHQQVQDALSYQVLASSFTLLKESSWLTNDFEDVN